MTAFQKPMKPDSVVSVLVVAGNDAAVLPDFLTEVHKVLAEQYTWFELVIVDNASTDGTALILEEHIHRLAGMRWLRMSRQYSWEIAWAAALEHCIGDFAVLMDIYGDPPDVIPQMVEVAERESAVVIGQYSKKPVLPWHYRLARWVFYKLAGRVLDHQLSSESSYFRIYPRQVVNALTRIKNRRRYLQYFSELVGYKQVAFPIVPDHRRQRHKTKRLWESLRDGVDLLISNSIRPLRWATCLGLAACFVNFAYLMYILVVFLVRDRLAEGWFTQSVMSTTMFFCMFLVLTILGEYVGRILEEVHNRPLYFLEFEKDSPMSRHQTDDVLNVA